MDNRWFGPWTTPVCRRTPRPLAGAGVFLGRASRAPAGLLRGWGMSCTCVVGLQWGDEAKGKIVDLLTAEHDFVVRYNGGANAGHTVVRDGKTYKLSLLPTGILSPNLHAVIANGVVVNPVRFLEEIKTLRDAGIAIGGNLHLGDHAHLIFPYHS